MGTHTALQQLKEAKQIAKDHGMFVAEKKDQGGTSYLLYREGYPRNIFLGKRASTSGIRSLVAKCASWR